MRHDLSDFRSRALALREQVRKVRPIYWYALGGAVVVAIISVNLARFARGARLLLTTDTLRKAMPGLPWKPTAEEPVPLLVKVLPHLQDALEEAQINTPMRIAAFLAQTGSESGDFKFMEEIASGSAYENRDDLGNTQKGDGVRFKGRGPIQLTGRANYTAFSKAMGKGDLFVRQPELVATYEWGFKASAWYWNSRNLNKYADKGQFNYITFRINGGCRASQDRDRRYLRAKAALGIPNAPEIKEFLDWYGRPSVCCPVGPSDGRVGRPGCSDSVA